MGNNANGRNGFGIAQEHLTANIPVAHPQDTLSSVELRLHKHAEELDTINYVYVTDAGNRLVGVFSIKELYRNPNTSRVREIMQKDPVAVFPKTRQDHVARTAIKHSVKAVPVVDKERKLLGVVPSDKILKILEEEQTKDVLRMAGVHVNGKPNFDISKLTALSLYRRRIPWLILGLAGGLGAAMIIELFDATLELHILLAAFIPAVVYIADAVGTQTQTLFIRSTTIDDQLNIFSYLSRESRVGILLSLTLGLIAGAFVLLRWGEPSIGIIVALSFSVAILLAMAVAVFLPWLFTRMKLDPAVASGPFATVIRDLTTLVIYFSIANWILTSM